MKRNIVYFYTSIVVFLTLFTIKAPAKTEISLLTCKPHAQIYSLYGHTAIRVVDTEQNMDLAINWGVFDASQPNFVAKFVLGFTNYTMAIVPTDYFLREYEYYGSSVYQQRLNLTEAEKTRIMKALMTTIFQRTAYIATTTSTTTARQGQGISSSPISTERSVA